MKTPNKSGKVLVDTGLSSSVGSMATLLALIGSVATLFGWKRNRKDDEN